jgi:hypothetical protein
MRRPRTFFSDKTVAWPPGDDERLSWKRWYKRAILKSVDQIRGAERWIEQFPDRIFLDRQCTQPLPIRLPPKETRKVHGIVVALGAGEACKRHFGGGTGSLFIAPGIAAYADSKSDSVTPFFVGDVDPNGPFIHVLDDATLDIVLGELDTITDFSGYLSKKEKFVRSGRLMCATGEEELVAYYATHMNSEEEHDFTKPDGTAFGPNDTISLDAGFYDHLQQNPQYRAKKSADADSYIWDQLILAFTRHMLDGTTIVPEGEPYEISILEEGVRQMALVPRYLRRTLGQALIEALRIGATTDRFTRAVVPGPAERHRDTAYFFMTLARPKFELAGGYNQYRAVRRSMLETYAFAFLQKFPELKQVVGIAMEPPTRAGGAGSSEDLIVARPGEWSAAFVEDLERRKRVYSIAQEGNFTFREIRGNEYPDAELARQEPQPKLSRRERRARASNARRDGRKRARRS